MSLSSQTEAAARADKRKLQEDCSGVAKKLCILEAAQQAEAEPQPTMWLVKDLDADIEYSDEEYEFDEEMEEGEGWDRRDLIFEIDPDFQPSAAPGPGTRIGKYTTMFANTHRKGDWQRCQFKQFQLIPDLKIQGLQTKVDAVMGSRKFKVEDVTLWLKDDDRVFILVSVVLI
uniref:ORF9 n=1 Tax=Lymantria dispar multicapsid nuclear polyhedrosis virus TaxID=10449 RepID=A0A2S1XBL4_NPVLD|nr:ORF9 [Lymantria dispar multiple nucleopolyhedrovirus]